MKIVELKKLDLVILETIDRFQPVTAIEISNFLSIDKYRVYISIKKLKKNKEILENNLRPKQYFLKNG